ncbi:LysE family translocator [Ectobacillus ponti]|uniref:LysE family translocator n=1 Tax=Ectobacillus ponti TaxID=2961894 RepID=A0AA41X358_9BACI|nr:LysE family translocator [Ectobacillus ponti]MCP8967757.1 LysE family translocator [Ectobacillus ponti]
MSHYPLFIAMAMLLIILPGPDTALVTQNTLTHSRKGGFRTALGISTGILIHTLAAVLGISAIIVKSAVLFSIFKYAGAVYLIYLGCMSLWSTRKKGATREEAPPYKGKSGFQQGFLTNLLNPKVAVFFLTFLPQFLDGGSNTFLQLLMMGLTYGVLTFAWFLMYIYLVDRINAWMKKPSTQQWIGGVSGLVLIGFGVKLVLEKRQ